MAKDKSEKKRKEVGEDVDMEENNEEKVRHSTIPSSASSPTVSRVTVAEKVEERERKGRGCHCP